MKKLNPDQICSITIYLKKRNRRYRYQKRKTFLGMQTQAAGFRDRFCFRYEDYVKQEDILKNDPFSFIEGDVVYRTPYIEINMSDRTSEIIRFKDEDELNNYMNIPDFRNKRWITINAD